MARNLALVVEDEPVIRFSTAAIICDVGLDVLDFSNAELALAHLNAPGQADDVCLLVTDVHMPGGAFTGLHLARIACRTWPWIRVIVASGWLGEDDPLPGQVLFLPKPWAPNDIIEAAAAARTPG